MGWNSQSRLSNDNPVRLVSWLIPSRLLHIMTFESADCHSYGGSGKRLSDISIGFPAGRVASMSIELAGIGVAACLVTSVVTPAGDVLVLLPASRSTGQQAVQNSRIPAVVITLGMTLPGVLVVARDIVASSCNCAPTVPHSGLAKASVLALFVRQRTEFEAFGCPSKIPLKRRA